MSSSSFAVTRFEEPFVSPAVGATASAPELHCLMNRPGRHRGRWRCAAAWVGALCAGAFVRRSASLNVRSCAHARGEAVPRELGGFAWRRLQSL